MNPRTRSSRKLEVMMAFMRMAWVRTGIESNVATTHRSEISCHCHPLMVFSRLIHSLDIAIECF